ncbi:MAG: Hpt domain-containing protein, partial [Acidobacteria bacterium]
PSPAPRRGSVIDPNALSRLRQLDGDGTFLAQVIELYRRDAPRQLAAIDDALAAGDAAALERAAHTLKGSAGELGAHRVHRLADRLTERARRRQIDGNAELVAELHTAHAEADRVLAALAGG